MRRLWTRLRESWTWFWDEYHGSQQESPEDRLVRMGNDVVASREKAVQLITQKNRLMLDLDRYRKKSEELESEASLALEQGNREKAVQFRREKEVIDAEIPSMQTACDEVSLIVEQVKEVVKEKEVVLLALIKEARAKKEQIGGDETAG